MHIRQRVSNLFSGLPADSAVEQFQELLTRPGLRIERIVSTGQASPPGFWYAEPHGEWVVVLRGRAALAFEDNASSVVLEPGDFVDIAPHRRHRVEWTHPEEPTIWLAVHYTTDSSALQPIPGPEDPPYEREPQHKE